MNVVYFTQGSGVLVSHIREQLLRIPEVLSEIRKSQVFNPDWDLMVSLMVPEVFEELSSSRKEFLVAMIQRALFERWMKNHPEVHHILRRAFYPRREQILDRVSCFLQTSDVVKIYVIGPGMDDLEFYIRQMNQDPTMGSAKKIEIIEVLSLDPALYWFWPQVKSSLIQNQIHSH